MDSATARPMIEARNISKYFGRFMAVKDITFSIPQGQIAAFLGPNGAGKTTTMRILTGFLRPSKGSASIAGLDITRQRLEATRRLGYLPENGPLYDNMTPVELLRFFGEARGLKHNTLDRRIETVSQQCALDNILEKPIGKLSRGYRQRVGMAQALLHDPEVLIMDEPTAGLDPNQIREFRSNITELATGKTILLSTHILQEAEAVANRVLLVNNGQLVFDGTPDELRQGRSLEESFYELTDYGRVVPAALEEGGAES
jgi:ABC-2 type transport system ATP-binding protein